MKRNTKNILKLSLVAVLIAVMALSLLSCSVGGKKYDTRVKTITVEVVHKSGEKVGHVIETDTTNLGDALIESGFVEGDNGQYGLYITSVDGEVADYSVDSSFWAITKAGEEVFTGASETPIADGEHYELTYTVYN